MYLTEILSEWILSQCVFLMWVLSLFISTQWQNIVFESLPWIIALLGVSSAFFGPYLLWRHQQKKELKTLANAFIIDLDRIYNSNHSWYTSFKQIQGDTPFVFPPRSPFYDEGGAYFLFIKEIYKFDDDLSLKILKLYDNLLSAESSRKFFNEQIKSLDDYITYKHSNDLLIMGNIDMSYTTIKSGIISTIEQIPDLKKRLEKVRDIL